MSSLGPEARPGFPFGAAPDGGPPQSLFSRRRIRILYLTAITLAFLALAYRLREVLNPFLLALLLAYMLDPAVQFLERRVRLPRTAAVLTIYVFLGAGVFAAGWYSVGRTIVGVDKVMTKVLGGWQILPQPLDLGAGKSWWSGLWTTPAPPQKRIPELPIYADDEIVENPNSPTLGWLEIKKNGLRDALDPIEPEFTRDSGGRWRPTPEFTSIVVRVPGYLDDIRDRVATSLPENMQIEKKQVDALADQVQSGAAAVISAGGTVWQWVRERLFGGLATVLLYCILVPIYSFFLLRGFDDIVAQVRGLLPGRHRDRIESIVRRIDLACAAFFRGRFLICLGKGALTWLGLWLVGVEFSMTIGMLAGLLSIIPAIGPVTGMVLAVILSYGPDGAWVNRIVGAGFVFAIVEALEGIVNPILLGQRVGLHPVTLLIAIFIFGDLFGFFGVLLAVPLAAVAKILGQEFILPELRHLAAENPLEPVSGIFPALRAPPPAADAERARSVRSK